MREMPMIRKLGLEDKFPRTSLHAQKTRLGVGINAPKTTIDMVAMRVWVEKKRLKGDLRKITEAHEKNSFIDSGLRKKERREESSVEHCKEK